jgi:hypothetical protein
VLSLRGKSGTVSAPGAPIGDYVYSVLEVSGTQSQRSISRRLYSYGTVPFATVCRYLPSSDFAAGGYIDGIGGAGCTSGTNQLGSTPSSFAYAAIANDQAAYPSSLLAVNDPSSTCRSVSLQFAEGNQGTESSFTTYVEIAQRTAGSQSASAQPNSVGSLQATLANGSWTIYVSTNDSEDQGSFSNYSEVLLNGTFSCYTPTGK